MAFGFDIFRRTNFPLPKFGLSYTEAPPPVSVTSPRQPTFAAPDNPVLLPGLNYKPRSSWDQFWDTPSGRSGKTRAENLGEIGSILRDREEHLIPTPTVNLPSPVDASLPGRGGPQGSRDVLQRVKARYGL